MHVVMTKAQKEERKEEMLHISFLFLIILFLFLSLQRLQFTIHTHTTYQTNLHNEKCTRLPSISNIGADFSGSFLYFSLQIKSDMLQTRTVTFVVTCQK